MDIITTHKNTDFDGLASVIAGTLLYPGAIGVIPKMVNRNVERFLSTHKTAFNIILPHEVNHDEVARLIIVDTNQWKRLDRMEKLRERSELIIHLWDHHDQQGDIEPDWTRVETIGATVTLMIREMKRRQMKLTPLDSTILLLGLYEDTGHLTFPSTQAEDAEAASYLLKNGADLNIASVFLNPPYEEMQKEILFKMMQNTEKIIHHSITIGVSSIHLSQKVPMLSTVVNMYRNLINVQVIFAIFENEDMNSTVIGRSGTDRVDVGAILKQLGGGGHPAAASASIKSQKLSPGEIKKKLLDIISKDKLHSAVIADLMSYPVTMVGGETPMREVHTLMGEQKIRGVLVGTENNLEGIIVLWDFKKVNKDRQWKSPVKAFMKRKVMTIPPDMEPAEAAQIMVKKNIGHLPVEHKSQIIGIVTRTDVLTYFYNMLPE